MLAEQAALPGPVQQAQAPHPALDAHGIPWLRSPLSGAMQNKLPRSADSLTHDQGVFCFFGAHSTPRISSHGLSIQNSASDMALLPVQAGHVSAKNTG